MSQATLSSVVGFLQEKELLTPGQVQQLSANGPLELGAFIREAARRQWLTAYQVNRIASGHPEELIVGAYRLLEPIGEGGMGKVFKARHVRMDRIVGLKIIPEEYLGNATALSRFYREVRAVAQLSHPNIVTAYEANQEGRTHYFAMEYLDGIDLAKLVKQSGPLPVSQACDFIRQAALGLQHAHEKGLVHRDIKPGNIMAARSSQDGDPVIKVLDFGLARLETTNQPATRLTKVGSILGTVDYMSPEQANDATVDIRSDIFSLGCSLFYLLAGTAPFPGQDAVERVLARLITDAPAIGTLRTDVPVALEKVLAKMLARNPAERIQTPIEVAEALKPFVSATGSVGSHPTTSSRGLPRANATLLPSYKTETISQEESGVVDRARQGERVKAAAAEDFRDLISSRPSSSKKGSKRPLVAVGIVTAALGLLIGLWASRRAGTSPKPVPGPVPAPAPDGDNRRPAKTFTNSLGMKFVLVPKGKSWLGGGGGKLGTQEVEITHDFYLGKYEVTQEEWQKVMGNNPSDFKSVPGVSMADVKRFPVEQVSWEDAQKFLKALNEKLKETGWVYRLPKEVEWEYACRGGPMTEKEDSTYSGFNFYLEKPTNQLLPDQANFAPQPGKGLQRTCKVGTYKPNRLGLYDMHGNVWEWCQDEWKDDKGASRRVFRGGSWSDGSGGCWAGYRLPYPPAHWYKNLGLRLARVPSGKEIVKIPATEKKPPVETDYDEFARAGKWVPVLKDKADFDRVWAANIRIEPKQAKPPRSTWTVCWN